MYCSCTSLCKPKAVSNTKVIDKIALSVMRYSALKHTSTYEYLYEVRSIRKGDLKRKKGSARDGDAGRSVSRQR